VYSPAARPPAEWFHLAVIGESHEQETIRGRVRSGDIVELRYEVDELDGSDGMFVCLRDGRIGRLDFDRARQMRQEMASGYRYAALVHGITGGTTEKVSLGVVLRVVRGYPGVSEDEFQRCLAAAKTAPDDSDPGYPR
jgi:hypothetical protein